MPRAHPDGREPLDTVAKIIEALWKSYEDKRLTCALRLKEAEERHAAGEAPEFATFEAWCTAKLPNRSWRDIRRLLEIAKADNPAEAMRERRKTDRENTHKWREKEKAKKAKASDSRESSNASTAAEEQAAEDPEDLEASLDPQKESAEPPPPAAAEPEDDTSNDDKIFERALDFLRRQRHRPEEDRLVMAYALLEALDVYPSPEMDEAA